MYRNDSPEQERRESNTRRISPRHEEVVYAVHEMCSKSSNFNGCREKESGGSNNNIRDLTATTFSSCWWRWCCCFTLRNVANVAKTDYPSLPLLTRTFFGERREGRVWTAPRSEAVTATATATAAPQECPSPGQARSFPA